MDRSKWEYKKLGDCFVYIKNGANIKQVNGATGIPITRIETLSNDVFNRDRMGYANIDDVSPYSSNILNDGDILMSHINSMKFLGRAVEYKKIDEEVIIHGMNLLRMIPTSNFLSSYAVYQFKTDHFRKQIKAISHQAVNQASFNVTNLKGLNLIVPPVADQQRIVAELDCLNEMIALKQEQLKEFDKLAQSIFYDMFGNPVSNEKGWGLKPMKDVCGAIGDGLHGTPQYDDNGTIAFINGNNLVDGKIVITERTQFVNEIEAKKIFIELDTNTVLLSINGTLGKTAVYNNEKVVLGKSACYLRLSKILDVNFVMALMNTNEYMGYLENNSSKSTIKNVGLKAIRNFPIILPPLALQQQFAEKIQAIEAQKELVKKSIAETQHLLDSRMDYYFD